MLEMKHVSAGYGRTRVLYGVSVSFEKGQVTSIVGANGCGKSTLLKTALGILPPTEGELLVDGSPLVHMTRQEIARRMAYLAQGTGQPDMTVEQLVLLGRFAHLRYPRRYTAVDLAIAHRAMERLGLTPLASHPVEALSGGWRQTAYLAMALAQQTDYILLDEPTTHLDIAHQLTLMHTLRALAADGRGIVAVMHDLPMALSFSDTIAVMERGRVLCTDTPKAVYASGLLERVFGASIGQTEDHRFFYRYDTEAK